MLPVTSMRLDPNQDCAKLLPLIRQLKAQHQPGRSLRIGLLGDSTTSYLPPLLEAFLWQFGLEATIYAAPFGVLAQEILTPDSEFFAWKPQLALLLPHASALPTAGRSPRSISPSAALDYWQKLWGCLNAWRPIPVVQSNYVLPLTDPLGNLAGAQPESLTFQLAELNRLLAAQAPANVHIHDTDRLAATLGRRVFSPPSWWYAASLSPALKCLPRFAYSLAALTAAVCGKAKKLIVLDLDNTLWGGAVGENGPEGIEIGQSPLGRAFQDFQRYLRGLRERGILLAAVSKNDPGPAMRPFRERPEMILGLDDFVAFRASWDNKPDVVRALAHDLALGLDSFVFIDDEPLERELMRHALPEVTVLDLPEDPAEYALALDAAELFQATSISAEDRERSSLYRAEQQRRTRQSQAVDLESYLQSLEMTLEVLPLGGHIASQGQAHAAELARVVQLLGKTNQFNLTGRRYSENELQQPQCLVLAARLRDTFGSQGIVSAIVMHLSAQSNTLCLDNWVMSCRVLKRGVEQGLFSALVKWARGEGITCLQACRVPSERNGLTVGLLPGLGFAAVEPATAGSTSVAGAGVAGEPAASAAVPVASAIAATSAVAAVAAAGATSTHSAPGVGTPERYTLCLDDYTAACPPWISVLWPSQGEPGEPTDQHVTATNVTNTTATHKTQPHNPTPSHGTAQAPRPHYQPTTSLAPLAPHNQHPQESQHKHQ